MEISTKIVRKRKSIQRRSQFFVYILECCDGSFYTGYTNDLQKRLALHNKGTGSKYVRTRLPVEIIFFRSYRYFKLAIQEERRIKTLTRKQKELLIRSGLNEKNKNKIKKSQSRISKKFVNLSE